MASFDLKEEEINIFKFDITFIKLHLDELINLVDYIPFLDSNWLKIELEWDKSERENFLKSQGLYNDILDMDELLLHKCFTYDDSVKAINSILIEWINMHPEFERIISKHSFSEYQNIKTNKNFLDFLDLLYEIKLPSEKKVWIPQSDNNLRDDSTLQFNLEDIEWISDEYGYTLISDYFTYLVSFS